MIGIFKIKALGKDKSKSGKHNYTFINGFQNGENALFSRATTFNCWIGKDLNLTFLDEIQAEIDVIASKEGQFCKLLSVLDESGEWVPVEKNEN